MIFEKTYERLLTEGSAFRSRKAAEDYCRKVRLGGIRCRPRKISSNPEYWWVSYDYDKRKLNEAVLKHPTQDDINRRYAKYYRETGIHKAVESGDYEAVAYLIGRGDDPDSRDSRDSSGSTALMIAAAKDNMDIMKLLINVRADVNKADNDGNTALMYSALSDTVNSLLYLIGNGADVNAIDSEGRTALMMAAERGNIGSSAELIDAGANVNARDFSGYTALIISSYYGYNYDVVKLLLDNGADVNAENNGGDSAMTVALRNGYGDIVELLKKHGAKE